MIEKNFCTEAAGNDSHTVYLSARNAMEQLITALELRAEAIAEEIEALEALASELEDPYRSRVSDLLLRIGVHVT